MPSSTYKIRKALTKSELNAPFDDVNLIYFMGENEDKDYVYLTLYEEQERANQLRIKKSNLPKEDNQTFSTTLFNLADQKQKRKDKQNLFGLISQTTSFVGIFASAIILFEFLLSVVFISFSVASGLAALIIPCALPPLFIYSLGKFYHSNTASKIKGSLLALSTGTIFGAMIGLAVFLFGLGFAGFGLGVGIGLSLGIGAGIGLLASSIITLFVFFHAKSLEVLTISDISNVSVHKNPETNMIEVSEKHSLFFYRHFSSYSDESSDIDLETVIIRKGKSHQGWFPSLRKAHGKIVPEKTHEKTVPDPESSPCSSDVSERSDDSTIDLMAYFKNNSVN